MRVVLTCFLVALITFQDTYAQEDSVEDEHNAQQGGEATAHQLVDPVDLETMRNYQGEDLILRNFEDDDWKQVVGGVDYSEKEVPKSPRSSLPIAFSWDGLWLKIIAYVLAGIAVLIALYFVIRNIPLHLLKKKVSDEAVDPNQPVEDIESLDALSLLYRAIRDGDLKLAVRLYYLNLLKQLNERGLIVWKKDKTNRDYLDELFLRDLFFDDIRHLTLTYESVWYGDHAVKPESFKTIGYRFETILEKINNSEGQ